MSAIAGDALVYEEEASLRLLARQHEAVARFGRRAVTETNGNALLQAACALAAGIPDVVAAAVMNVNRVDVLASAGESGHLAQLVRECRRPACGSGELCDFKGNSVICVVVGSDERSDALFMMEFEGRKAAERDAWLAESIAATLSDALRRLRAEKELASSRQALAEAQRVARIGSWYSDLGTGLDTWSDEMHRILGTSPSDVVPSLAAFLSVLHPDDRSTMEPLILECIETNRPPERSSWEARIRDRSGNERILLVTSDCVFDQGMLHEVHGTVQDITERKQAEDERFRQEQELQVMVHDSPDFMARLDRECRPLFVNSRVSRFLRLPVEQILGRTPSELGMPADFCAAVSNAVTSVFETGQPFSCSVRFPLRGTQASLHMRFAPQFSRTGCLESVIGTARDVTELMNVSRQLARAQKIARLGTWEWDPATGLVEMSEEMVLMFGGPLDGSRSTYEALMALVCEDDKAEVVQTAQDLLSGRTSNAFFRYRVCQGDGSWKTVESHGQSLFDAEGKVIRIVGTAQDVTQRVEAAAERERLTRMMELFLESTSDGIYIRDLEGRCTLANPAACRILGYSGEELVGKNMHALIHGHTGGSEDDCRISEVLRTRRAVHLEETFIHRDGRSIPVEVHAAPMIENDVVIGSVVSFVDTTDRRELQSGLERARRLSSLGQLAATMAHEFNNVLMGIQPFAEVIRRRSTDESVSKAVGQILQSITRGRTVTQEILRYSRPSEPVRSRLDVGGWLGELLPELQSILPPAVTLRNIQDDPDLFIQADGSQLAQIITNLVVNARDAMPLGGVITIRVGRCRIGSALESSLVRAPHRFVHLSVTDTGEGIPASILEKIFEPFISTKKRGTGLGLAVAQQITEAHGGRIAVESRIGEGTTFHLVLPASEPLDPAVECALPAAGSILIVEDDEHVASGLAALLEERGYRPRIAGDARTSFAELSREIPDAVILDVGLPDMSGLEVYRRLQRSYPGLPVVFSTAHTDAQQVRQMLEQPDVAVLTKPYDAAALFGAVQRAVRARSIEMPA